MYRLICKSLATPIAYQRGNKSLMQSVNIHESRKGALVCFKVYDLAEEQSLAVHLKQQLGSENNGKEDLSDMQGLEAIARN